MEFFKCSIGGEVYGSGVTEIEQGGAQRNGIKVQEVCIAFEFKKKPQFVIFEKKRCFSSYQSFLYSPCVEIRKSEYF